MKKIREIKAKCFYAIEGSSAEGSVFIEDMIEAKKFIELINDRLQGFCTIHNFLLEHNHWTLMVSMESKNSIVKRYQEKRKLSLKGKVENTLTEIWKIVSEQFRHILSMYIKFTNYKQGRKGSKVKRNYERSIFESVEEAEEFMESLKNQCYQKLPRKKRYRAKRNLWKMIRKVDQGHVFLCGKEVKDVDCEDVYGEGSLYLSSFLDNVLRKLIKSTILLHQSIIITKNHPNTE
jgi:hypothetical protein